jgi:hypothetical protein
MTWDPRTCVGSGLEYGTCIPVANLRKLISTPKAGILDVIVQESSLTPSCRPEREGKPRDRLEGRGS